MSVSRRRGAADQGSRQGPTGILQDHRDPPGPPGPSRTTGTLQDHRDPRTTGTLQAHRDPPGPPGPSRTWAPGGRRPGPRGAHQQRRGSTRPPRRTRGPQNQPAPRASQSGFPTANSCFLRPAATPAEAPTRAPRCPGLFPPAPLDATTAQPRSAFPGPQHLLGQGNTAGHRRERPRACGRTGRPRARGSLVPEPRTLPARPTHRPPPADGQASRRRCPPEAEREREAAATAASTPGRVAAAPGTAGSVPRPPPRSQWAPTPSAAANEKAASAPGRGGPSACPAPADGASEDRAGRGWPSHVCLLRLAGPAACGALIGRREMARPGA
ncbi:basic salivary proline-rich protein 1-like [Ochotona curzoniae]|uniref:basic salivary proline-rich protein 1-like n=1 Tax=Ochotona curzoniae TaxID=130825 RepID=UPI001B3468AD|nr:basic salivary proline-rich protein 1-like [Ochotona curzoniae]